ncbi:MAG: hypothetical protein A3C84_03565 [Candidatus Ryanbacteria bacterium RIFCSPHIGHO2_02_FULL_48_12]|uniref:FAD/NAD(P)-binding domain-containing protein n=1 Tax=Candidatus Ryanbacteria bacterium RIFCSPHIGHO2_01_FULL_48_27 TaxID=1802115 RepID=A0A1G2G6G3_9BACT|nr:MAG: hypothetical protein A2756_02930 [Candidatus Ryanbacteria bacterium RIFCSPHIGHO2_01_FULL_48_27]OGZ49420.1 MAG: hypothetical protein A3C84_03565 [Candidatus Ryanbacteria bacterium RIFCSPHIGHO2_02_FULL_48_12]
MRIGVDYLILGGGIAGTTAAETIRRDDKDGKIAILSGESHVLYSRVLLPAYVQGRIPREKVFLRTLTDYERNAIQLFLGESAVVVDAEKKEVQTSAGNTFFFEQLLISTGGQVQPWRVGRSVPDVARLQTLNDADDLIARIHRTTKKHAVVVGAGFIGMEFVNSLVANGFSVDLITKDGGCWFGHLGKDGSDFLEMAFPRNRVALHPASEVSDIKLDAGTYLIRTTRNDKLEAGLLAVGIGLERNLTSFQGQGFEIGKGIKTNEYLETNFPYVWAAGDIAEYYNVHTKKHALVGNWSHAFLQGRAAGLNMSAAHLHKKTKTVFEDVPTYSITVLGNHVTFLGDSVIEGSKETLARADEHGRFFEKFFLKDNLLVGAIMINKFEDKKVLEALIKHQVDITTLKPFLVRPEASIKDLDLHEVIPQT